MKRAHLRAAALLSVCLALLCCLGCSSGEPTLATARRGDVITFGQFYVDDDEGLDDLEWVVLANEDDRLFLVTKDIVLYGPYAHAEDYTEYLDPEEPWKSSLAREMLNGNTFYSTAFTEEEQAAIESVQMGGVECRVFLPGQSEVLSYMPDKFMGATFTPYAESLRDNAYSDSIDGVALRTVADKIGSSWVLRETDSEKPTTVVLVSEDGTVFNGLNDGDGNPLMGFPIQGYYGIRPAIIVDVP